MRRIVPFVLVLALLLGGLSRGGQIGAAERSSTYVVDLAAGVSSREAASIARAYGGRRTHVFDRVVGGFAFVGTPSAAGRLAKDGRVASVEADLVYRATGAPTADLKHMERTDGYEAYNAGYTGAGVTIALLDTGVNKGHEVFADHDNILAGKSCAGGGTNDGEGHGTASASNAVGKIGVAHEAKVIPVKVFPGGSLSTTLSRLICGLNWVKKHNDANPGDIDIVNMSIAGPGSRSLKKAVRRVLNAGIEITAAAGNNGGATLYPARYAGVIAVTALGGDDKMASFSASGGDLTAPGVKIKSAENTGNKYSIRSGTSRSAPQVAGAAAIVLSENPLADVLDTLRTSGRCPNGDKNLDGGFCNGPQWKGDDAKPEALINAYCAGILADLADTDVPACGF